ncbi:MAG: hypothetical protein R6W75_10560 [Smithellaceae bacterium]
MIYYLVTRDHDYTVRSFLATWGGALKPYLKVLPYETLFRQDRLSTGAYIFSDIERLDDEMRRAAALIADALCDQGGTSVCLLNHPVLSMTRYALLRCLYQEGLNDFNVYRMTDDEGAKRFPVFIRNDNDHEGAQSELIKTPEALAAAVRAIEARGTDPRNKIVTEFCDTADADGIFRKYSCFCVAGEIIPRHVCFGRHWMLKYPDLSGPEWIRRELDFIRTNPHEAHLKKIFNLARIAYGRIDYSLKGDRVEVWEINTNPGLVSLLSAGNPARRPVHEAFLDRFLCAMRRLDVSDNETALVNPVCLDLRSEPLTKRVKNLSLSAFYALPVSVSAKAFLHQRLVNFKRRILPEQNDGKTLRP